MRVRVEGEKLGGASAFKLIATGYFFGAIVIFVPIFVLIGLFTIIAGGPTTVNGEAVGGNLGRLMGISMILIAPCIVAIQSVVIGVIGTFGLWIYQKWRRIRISTE